jgi:hypothetical protein
LAWIVIDNFLCNADCSNVSQKKPFLTPCGDLLKQILARQRHLKVEKALSDTAWLVSCDKTAYLAAGCKLTLTRDRQGDKHKSVDKLLWVSLQASPLIFGYLKTNNEKVLPFKCLALVRKLNLFSGKVANQA